MQLTAQTLRTEEPAHPEFITINTTLYELIEVISKEVDPVEDRLVPEIVSDWFDRGLIKLPDSMGKSFQTFPLTDNSL